VQPDRDFYGSDLLSVRHPIESLAAPFQQAGLTSADAIIRHMTLHSSPYGVLDGFVGNASSP
jgi:hypothetical protein